MSGCSNSNRYYISHVGCRFSRSKVPGRSGRSFGYEVHTIQYSTVAPYLNITLPVFQFTPRTISIHILRMYAWELSWFGLIGSVLYCMYIIAGGMREVPAVPAWENNQGGGDCHP